MGREIKEFLLFLVAWTGITMALAVCSWTMSIADKVVASYYYEGGKR